jgi:hypothetical protein
MTDRLTDERLLELHAGSIENFDCVGSFGFAKAVEFSSMVIELLTLRKEVEPYGRSGERPCQVTD